MEKARIGYIDSLKGFAAILVIIGHICDGYLDRSIYCDKTGILLFLFKLIYSFHMPLFFILSGYIFFKAYYKNGGFEYKKIKSQIINLGFVYVLFSVAMWVFKLIFSRYSNKPGSLLDILLLWCKTISPYWYLYVLVGEYLLVILLKRYKIKNLYIIGFALIIGVLSSIFGGAGDYFEITRIAYYFLFFYIGCLWAEDEKTFVSNKKIVLLIGAFSFILLIVVWNTTKWIYAIPVLNAIIALGLSGIIIIIFKYAYVVRDNKFLQFVGVNALEVYVVHCFFTAGFRTILFSLGVKNTLISSAIDFVLSTSLALLFAYFSKYFHIHDYIFRPTKAWLKVKKC